MVVLTQVVGGIQDSICLWEAQNAQQQQSFMWPHQSSIDWMELIIILICRGHSDYLERFLHSDCGQSGHAWWQRVLKVHPPLGRAKRATRVTRAWRWKDCCALHSLREQNPCVLLCLFSNPEAPGGSGPQGQSLGRSRHTSGQNVLLRGDMGHLIVLWVRLPCMKGSVGRGEYPYKSLVFLHSTPLFQWPRCSCGSNPGADGKHLMQYPAERRGTAARTHLRSQIACPQNPAPNSSQHQASNSRARSHYPALHFPSVCDEKTSAWA